MSRYFKFIFFIYLLANPGSPGKMAIKMECVNVCVCFCLLTDVVKQVEPVQWTDVKGWAGAGGARLHTTRWVVCHLFLFFFLNLLSVKSV